METDTQSADAEGPLVERLHGATGGPSRLGGKGANLAWLTALEGVVVPPGICITTAAFAALTEADASISTHIAKLAVAEDDGARARQAREVRSAIRAAALPTEVVAAVAASLAWLGGDRPLAVRSSAPGEDAAARSFAGQHDSFLGIVGRAALLEAVRDVWASAFSDRAVSYRAHHGLPQDAVAMAVVVQRQVDALASGVLFTADPVTGHRATTTIEAVQGLGDVLVAGQASPESWSVCDGTPTRTRITDDGPVLREEEVRRLRALGRQIEQAAGAPQDLEWCWTSEGIAVVQSRPITGLFPIPDGPRDGERHVYVSVGHQQMMTDAMRPLGLSVWQLTAIPPMHAAAGRLFVDIAPRLASPARDALIATFAQGDPLLGDAVQSLVDRPGYLPAPPPPAAAPPPAATPDLLPSDPQVVADLIAQCEASRAAYAQALTQAAGADVFAVIRADLADRKRHLTDPRNHQAVMAGMDASWWLAEHLERWLGESGLADTLTLSAPGNVTSEMGLMLLDVADAIRPHPAVVAALEAAAAAGSLDLDHLDELDGGPAARAAFEAFLDRFGMRCAREIDITRPRWSEQPAALLPQLLGHVRSAEPGAGSARFEAGRRRAEAAAADVLRRLRALPDGERKAQETAAMIERVRIFIGYREYPKYDLICRATLARRALMAEAERLVARGALRATEDADFLTFDEFERAVTTGSADAALIDARRAEFALAERLSPPRVITADGEVIHGRYHRDDLPAGALPGIAVSRGVVEGRARVIDEVAGAELEPGDILVTTFTDPGWSPLFTAAAGLVTEIGGHMTHGAVVAREYGLPAVVGVERATTCIPDGARIRVHGTEGYVELLDPAEPAAPVTTS